MSASETRTIARREVERNKKTFIGLTASVPHLDDTNDKLEGKLKRELRPGARVVSNTFSFPGLHHVRQDGDARLYLCNMGRNITGDRYTS